MAELDEQIEQLKLDTPITVTGEEPKDYDYTLPPLEKQTGWGQFKKEAREASDKYFDFNKDKLGFYKSEDNKTILRFY